MYLQGRGDRAGRRVTANPGSYGPCAANLPARPAGICRLDLSNPLLLEMGDRQHPTLQGGSEAFAAETCAALQPAELDLGHTPLLRLLP